MESGLNIVTAISTGRPAGFGGFGGEKPRRVLVSAQRISAGIVVATHFRSASALTGLVFRQHDQVVAEHAQPHVAGKSLKSAKVT